MLERVWRKENPLALLRACLGIPRTEEPGGLQSMGSQRVGHNWSDLASLHYWWECKLIQPLWRTVWRFLKKTANRTALWPSNPTAGHTHWGNQNWKRHIYPKVHHCTVYNSQDMEATKCPLADEWIRKLWYIYTMEYYLALKKNAFESVLMRWIKMELIIQSEVTQKEKHPYSILTHIYGI